MNSISRLTLAIAALALASPAGAQSGGRTSLDFFDAYIGKWGPHPTSDLVRQNPERADDVAFLFEWAGDDKKILRFYEGVPDGDVEQRIVETLVTVNPRNGAILFLGYQTRNDYLYQGSFEPLDDGFVRYYDVTYPPGTQFRHREDERAGMISYRDTCKRLDADTLECLTEQRRGSAWQPWGEGSYRLVRLGVGASPVVAGGEAVACESYGNARQDCRADTGYGVALERQLSRSPCDQGETWGYDHDGIWVAGGCHARFRLGSPGGEGRDDTGFGTGSGAGSGGGAEVVACESIGDARRQCSADTSRGVTLERQLSRSPCTRGQTWGYTQDGIWVDGGCRAQFRLGSDDGGGEDEGWEGTGFETGSASSSGSEVVTCESSGNDRRDCRADTSRGVTLERQLSRSACTKGQTWGFTQDGIWVDRGCRAQFRLGG